MRALVAEANVVTRVTLRRILERTGFVVEELRDELAATCLLYQPDPPELALLALDTLLVDFEQVCAAMRAAKPEVYIVALVPEMRRHEVVSVIDAGADDFLIKPVTVQEGDARLRIIQRTLAAVGGSLLAGATAEAAAGEDAGTGGGHLGRLLKTLDLSAVFGQIGIGEVREIPAEEALTEPAFTAWSPMLLRQGDRGQWLNVRVDLGSEQAGTLFRAVQPRAAYSEQGLLNILREVMSLLQDGIGNAALRYEEAQVHMPHPPLARRADAVPPPDELSSTPARRRVVGLALGEEVRIQLSLTMDSIRPIERVISNLIPMDVLAADIQSAEYQIMLLRAGTLLNETFIAKIQAFIHSQNLSQKVVVFHPPEGTSRFLQNLQ